MARTDSKTVYLLVTHLLGSGHLARAAILARAFEAAGWRAVLVSGGRPAPHLTDGLGDLVQLPPLASDGVNFSRLLDAEGQEADAALMAERQRLAIAALEEARPDAVITELFPFGRRQLAAEFEAVLGAAQALTPRPAILCSVRDILQAPSKPERVTQTEARLKRFYDGVLVHGDPALIELGASWPVTPAIEAMLRYTGYIAPPAARATAGSAGGRDDSAGEVLVAAGGGPVGEPIFSAAALAAGRGALIWRLLVGGAEPGRGAMIDRLKASNPAAVEAGRLIVEPVRPDYRALLARAAVSVSQIGYNTAIDLVQAGCPAVLAPFDAGGETEQRTRAEAMAERFGMAALAPDALTGDDAPERLAAAVDTAISGGARLAEARAASAIDLDGAAHSVALTAEIVAATG